MLKTIAFRLDPETIEQCKKIAERKTKLLAKNGVDHVVDISEIYRQAVKDYVEKHKGE